MPPLFSIGIPTFNRATLLPDALRSALSQTFTDHEVIIRDNASTDETADVARTCADPRVRYFRNERNVGAERNFELIANDAVGQFLVILQDDDLLHPSFLARAAAAIESRPDLAVYAAYLSSAPLSNPQFWMFNWGFIIGPELPVPWDQAGPQFWDGPLVSVQCLVSTGLYFPAVVIRRELFLRHLPMDTSLGNAWDRYFTGRVATEGTVAVEAWVAGVSRHHPGQLTNQFGNYDRYLVSCARKLIEYFDSHSIDWRGLLRDWLAQLTAERRKHWLAQVLALPYPPELQESFALAVAQDTGETIESLLRQPTPIVRHMKHYARELTPPLLWRGARHMVRKILGSAN